MKPKLCRLCLTSHEPGNCLAQPIANDCLYIAPEPLVGPTPEPPVIEPEPAPTFEKSEPAQLIWTTAPDGFNDGIVVDVDPERGFIIIDWQGERILAHIKDIVTIANHICVFKNAPVIFRVYDPEKDRDVAGDVNLNVENDGIPEVEVSVVVEDRGTWYVLERECGCRIVLPGSTVGGSTAIGTKVRHRHIEADGRVTATAVEVLSDVAA